jgi:hypothetical protein
VRRRHDDRFLRRKTVDHHVEEAATNRAEHKPYDY